MNKQINDLTDLELAEAGMQLQAQLIAVQQEIQNRKNKVAEKKDDKK